jgi:hypothetical protein
MKDKPSSEFFEREIGRIGKLSPSLSIKTINSDVDTADRVFIYRIDNPLETPLTIHEIRISIPLSAYFPNQVEPADAKLREKHNQLCNELDHLLNDDLFFVEKPLFEKRKQIAKDLVREVLGGDWRTFQGIVLAYSRLVFAPFTAHYIAIWFEKRYRATRVQVDSYASASKLYALVTRHHNNASEDAQYYEASKLKLDELCLIEEELNRQKLRRIKVPSKGRYENQFAVRFNKHPFVVRSALVSMEVDVESDAESTVLRLTASASTSTTASNVWTSLIAVLFGAIGAYFTGALHGLTPGPSFGEANIPKIVIGAILGLILFSFIEHFRLGDTAKLARDWKSAVLLGLIGGGFQDNIISAMKALIGI